MRWTFGWRAASPVPEARTRDGRPIGRPSRCFGCSGAVRLQAELPDEALELLRGAGELLGGRGDLLRRGARLLRGGRDLLRGGRGLLGDRGDLRHVALDLLRARRDLLDRGGDLVEPAGHVLHRRAERQDRLARLLDRRDAVLRAQRAVLDDLDGLGRLGLDLADEPGDRAGRRLALLRQLADLLRRPGEAAALLARAGGLDGRVERQQVRLLGDAGDRGDDALDLLGLGAELTDGLGGLQGALADGADRLGGLRDSAGALLGHLARGDRRGRGLLRVARAGGAGGHDLLGGELGLLDRANLALGALGDLAHGGRDLADRATGLLGGGRHLLRRGGDGAGRARDLADQGGEPAAALGVGVERLDGLRADLVECARHVADLVGARVLDLRGLRLDHDREVAVSERVEAGVQARDADVAQHGEPLDDDLQRPDDAPGDEDGDAGGEQHADERGDQAGAARAALGRGGPRDVVRTPVGDVRGDLGLRAERHADELVGLLQGAERGRLVAAHDGREEVLVDGRVVLVVGGVGGLRDPRDRRVVQRLDGGGGAVGDRDAGFPLRLVARLAGVDVQRLRGHLLLRATHLLAGARDRAVPACRATPRIAGARRVAQGHDDGDDEDRRHGAEPEGQPPANGPLEALVAHDALPVVLVSTNGAPRRAFRCELIGRGVVRLDASAMRWTFGWLAASPVPEPRTCDGRPIGRPSRSFGCSGA